MDGHTRSCWQVHAEASGGRFCSPDTLWLQSAASGLDDASHLGCGVAFVDCGAGHEDLRSRFDHEGCRLGCDAAVHLDGRSVISFTRRTFSTISG